MLSTGLTETAAHSDRAQGPGLRPARKQTIQAHWANVMGRFIPGPRSLHSGARVCVCVYNVYTHVKKRTLVKTLRSMHTPRIRTKVQWACSLSLPPGFGETSRPAQGTPGVGARLGAQRGLSRHLSLRGARREPPESRRADGHTSRSGRGEQTSWSLERVLWL